MSFFAARWRADRSGDALLEADLASDNATEYVFLFFLDCRGAGNMSDVMTGTELAASGATENIFFVGALRARLARRAAAGGGAGRGAIATRCDQRDQIRETTRMDSVGKVG